MSRIRILQNLDLPFLVTAIVLILIGLLAIYSATLIGGTEASSFKFSKQLIWFFMGLVALTTAAFLPLRLYHKHAYNLYALSISLLVLVLVAGTGIATRRWLSVGPLWLQPSEIAKISTILALAKYLSHRHRNLNNLKEFIIALSIGLLPFILIMKQPDLGSALVFVALILPMLHWAGLSPVILFVVIAPFISLMSAFNYYTFFFAMVALCLLLFFLQRGVRFFIINFLINISVGVLTPVLWGMLKGYQQNRILSFLGLVTDPHGLGYQVIQSKVAIGSGGLMGKGFLDGTQTHLRFLPEQHTDFIFCVIGEEFGFIGVLITLLLFFYLIYKGLKISTTVKSKFTSLLVFGAVIVFMFQVFVNIGMTVGIMPVTGLPLPFLSYGGSSLLTNMLVIGIVLNTSRKRFDYI